MLKRLRLRIAQAGSGSLIASAFILLMACGLNDDTHAAAPTAPKDESVVPAGNSAATPVDPPGDGTASTALSLAETENLVRGHAAALLSIATDQFQTVEASARTWPDHGLGCGARRGVYEPEPTPGYLIVLSHGATTLSYHADQHGNFIRCDEASRPRGPIR